MSGSMEFQVHAHSIPLKEKKNISKHTHTYNRSNSLWERNFFAENKSIYDTVDSCKVHAVNKHSQKTFNKSG